MPLCSVMQSALLVSGQLLQVVDHNCTTLLMNPTRFLRVTLFLKETLKTAT